MRHLRVIVWGILIAAPVPAFAQGTGNRIWADVNLGTASSAAKATSFGFEGELFFEPLVLTADYPKPSSALMLDVGGGFLVTPKFGIGFGITRATHKDPVEVSILVPHPFFFDASTLAETESAAKLDRLEKATHVSAVFLPLPEGPVVLRLFGGLSFFRLEAIMVRDIAFDQEASDTSLDNFITITELDLVTATGTGTGFHAGADVSYFFTRNIGVGGFGRYSAATVRIAEEPMSEVEQKIKVGGFQLGGGVRVRF